MCDDVEVRINHEQTTEVTIENELKKGQVKVIKEDRENKEIKLENVEFNVIDIDGNILETIKTNEKGEAITSKYSVRDYPKIYIQEISTNENYILNDEKIEVKLEENKMKNITIKNEHKKGNLKIFKVDKDNPNVVLENVVFDLYNKNDNKKIGTYKTDKNGEIYIQDLKVGKYKIKEKETNKWYNLADEKEVEIKWNETTNITIEDELKKGQVKVIKEDSENKEIKLENVEFNVLDKKGNILENIKTNSNGEAITSKYPLKYYEKIYLQEISTNERYVLDNSLKEIKLSENSVEEIIVKNEKIKGNLKIVKTSKDDNKITKQKAGTPLEGIKFEIYDSNDKLVKELVTNKKGIAVTSKLEKGIYKIKETEGDKWYYTNENIFTAEIKENNEVVTVNITNESKNPDISTEKIGMDKAEIGSEIEYDISMKNSGNTYLDKFTWIDKIPTKYINVTKFKTGTYNQKLHYNLMYKTNLSNNKYILLMEDLDTTENYEIDFNLELADNEYVTEIKLEFGTVDIGFGSNENPHLFAKVKSELKSETTFTNTAKAYGKYNDYDVDDDSSWKTLVYRLLPKTGF